MGIYENTVDGMMTDYVFPQENGHHEQVKWFRIGDGKRWSVMQDGGEAWSEPC